MVTENTYNVKMKQLQAQWRDTLEEETLLVWYRQLRPVPDDVFVEACDTLMETDAGTRVPSLRRIQEVVCDLVGVPSAALAWRTLLRKLVGGASRIDVNTLDPATLRAIDAAGGLHALGRTEERDLPFRRREFETEYNAYRLTLLVPALSGLALPPGDLLRLVDGAS